MKEMLQYWIVIFTHFNKIVVDDGEKFDNTEFQTLGENFNIRICITAAEGPWSNDLIERHNDIRGLTVTKTMEDLKCDLQLVVSWAITAKNSLKMFMASLHTNLSRRKSPISQTYVLIYCLH